MNTPVTLPLEWLGKLATGTVVGIASIHVVFQYIVLLDEPTETEYGLQSAVVCGGPQLTHAVTQENWRFQSDEDRDEYLRMVNS